MDKKTRLELGTILRHRLEDGETIHHIDMDKSNNDPENLYIYKNRSEHIKGHGSLNKLVEHLLKNKIATFKDGQYRIDEYEFLRKIFKEDPDFTGSLTFNVFKGGITSINKKENLGLKKLLLWLEKSKEEKIKENEN